MLARRKNKRNSHRVVVVLPTNTDQQAQEPLSTSKHEGKPELPAFLKGIDGINLRATIVMEHLIQASDVAHTMQH
jgi:hypothetical protein